MVWTEPQRERPGNAVYYNNHYKAIFDSLNISAYHEPVPLKFGEGIEITSIASGGFIYS